jgi:hypothetical protein
MGRSLAYSLRFSVKDYLNAFLYLQVVYTPGQQDKCFLCGQVGHLAANCEGKAKRKAGEYDEKGEAIVPKKPYQVMMPCCNLYSLRVIFVLYYFLTLCPCSS